MVPDDMEGKEVMCLAMKTWTGILPNHSLLTLGSNWAYGTNR